MKFKLSSMYWVGSMIYLALAVISLILGKYDTGFLFLIMMNQQTILQRIAEEEERRQLWCDIFRIHLRNVEQEDEPE